MFRSVAAMISIFGVAGCVMPTDELAPVIVSPQGAPAASADPSGAVRRVSGDLAVDASATPAQVVAIQTHLSSARGAVAAALGSADARPQVTVCVTEACDKAQGFTTQGMSFADRWLHISSRAWDQRETYTHEMVHVETHTPALLLARAIAPVPIWFDEGLATVVSGTVGADLSTEECAPLASLALPVPQNGFGAFTRQHGYRRGYGAAACRVRGWMAQGHRTQDVIGLMRVGALPR